MIRTYEGEFKNIAELNEHVKQCKMNTYKNLAKRFAADPTMELSIIMSDLAQTLVNSFSVTWEEIEQLEA